MAGSMIFPESFTPPADRGATAGSRPPPWILLDLDTYIADRRNATTATATSRLGHTIQVSLYAADPPAMSYFCVHCPCSKPDDPAFAFEPRVVGAEGRFALLWVRFAHAGHDDDEYFMYKADPDSPSLEHVRRPGTHHRLLLYKQLAVVPLGDGGHYLLAGRSIANFKPPFKYDLHIYSSADQTWSIKPLPDACPDVHDILPDKVIPLGDGVVGWVDLRVGVAVCDLLRQPLDVRFIPLPQPMPANRKKLKKFHPGDPAWRFRDVAFSNGVLKFVEMEHRWIVTTICPAPEEPTDPSEKAVLLDSDLIMSRKRKLVDTKPKQVRKRDCWRMVTWSRPAVSSDCWHKGCIIDVDDIAVDDMITSSLRSGAWMVAVDLGKKTLLTALGAYSCDRHDPCTYNYHLCSLSKYLNMDPADSSQTTKLKDSADPLKTRQSSAEEASCPHKDKPRDAVRRLTLELKAQEDHRSIREHGAESNEECSSDSSGPLPPPARRHSNCLPPRPVIKQSDGASDRPNPADVSPANNVVARPTGSCSLLPQVPPQQDFGQSVQWRRQPSKCSRRQSSST
ncbi:unnamed protein product [Miscanthus lutarioriparius]|uniref:DUF1618 domain-containing protein n=1 Tax=Miscanthus lutarioriparius TaxID=422564 RepID=A0A811NM88_9POAL|nr:unnamed protein product [Miscanthus lutarioriparius]